MEILFDPQLEAEFPQLTLGLLIYEGITVEESPQMLKGRLQFFQELLYFDLEEKGAEQFPEIIEWREIYKELGADPASSTPMAESLLKRIEQQTYLTPLHSAADVTRFFSLTYRLPIGLYDRAKVAGNQLLVRKGKPGEVYLSSEETEIDAENLIVLTDHQGVVGSPSADSSQTLVDTEAKDVIQVVFLPPGFPADKGEKLLSSLAEMFIQINGGYSEQAIIRASGGMNP